jgi:hypothetical protein
LPAFVVFALEDGHSNWGEMKSESGFDMHFLIAMEVEHFFMYLLAICASP